MNGKLNKEKRVENFKFFSTSLFNNHKVKEIGIITMINWWDTSILEISTPNPTNPYTKK